MTAQELVATLQARGLHVHATTTQKVRVLGPVSHYRDLLDELHRNRDAILSLLPAADPEMADPRSDLLEDSQLWRRLLGMAWGLDGVEPCGLCANLSCLRCLGATLVRPDGHLRFKASGDYWTSERTFQAECRLFLEPYGAVLRGMLATLEAELGA